MSNDIKKYMEIIESSLKEDSSDDEVIPKSEVSFNVPDDDELTISDDDDERLFEAFGSIRRMIGSLNNKEKKFFNRSVSQLTNNFWTIEERIEEKTKRDTGIKFPVYDKKFFDDLIKSFELESEVKADLKGKHYAALNAMLKKYQGVRTGNKDKEALKNDLLNSRINPKRLLTSFIEDAAYYTTYHYFDKNRDKIQSSLDSMEKDRKSNKKDNSYGKDFIDNFAKTYMSRMKGKK